MPYYIEIESATTGKLTAKCGTKEIADRLSNTDASTGGGADFSIVNHFAFDVMQAHDEFGGANANASPFSHALTIVLPDYEPLVTAATNAMNKHDRITKVTCHFTQRINAQKEQIVFVYVFEDGLITNMRHMITDQRGSGGSRGQIELAFKFQKIINEDKKANTSGLMQTNSAGAA